MRFAIIDNSTLTAVQRLLGQIKIKNKYTIDGDILAFESFLQTILFYDDVFYIDDYKEEYQQQRNEFFKYLNPIRLEDEYPKIIEETQKLTDKFSPNISNKTFEDPELRKFFEQLKMNIIFNWNQSSSVYYLNYKLLQQHSGVDIEKYSALTSMIHNELSDKEHDRFIRQKTPVIYDSKGNVVNQDYKVINKDGYSCETGMMTTQTEKFLSGLNWIDFRTNFYILVANSLDMDLVLHPIRHAYEINIMNRYCSRNYSLNPIVDRMKGVANYSLAEINKNNDYVLLDNNMPMFSVWAASKCEDVSKFIDMIYEIKGQKEFIDARRKLDDINELSENKEKSVKKINCLTLEFDKQMEKLMRQYNVQSTQIDPLNSMITVVNIAAATQGLPCIPNLSKKREVPQFIKDHYRYNSFGAVFKNIINDLTSIERLGKYHDIITSNVWLANDAGYYEIKTEQPYWLNSKSCCKIPL